MRCTTLSILLICLFFGDLVAQNQIDTRLMSQPAVSEDKIAFIYAEDLWVANIDGSAPTRLTIDEGIESSPVFSRDGSLIAFSAQYDGNTDVFVVSSSGGVPRRLTWHPSSDFVRDFSADGTQVLFVSQRNSHTRRYFQLYTVPIDGGQVEQLPIPHAFRASYSPDGSQIAYTPLSEPFVQWKNYRGGRQTRIWVYNTTDHEVVEIPKPEGGSNDTDPQWMGDKVYFRSDRNGEFNLYSYDVKSKEVEQHTDYADFPVMRLSARSGQLVYEQAGYLHRFYPAIGVNSKITIGIATDLLELRSRFVSGNSYVRSGSISPTGVRVALDFRGEIVTVPAKKGDPRYLTQTPGTHETYPQWSPDGKTIAYFSDASGEHNLHLQPVNGDAAIEIELSGTGFYAHIHWSPDSERLCFVDNGRNLYVLEIASGSITKIATDEMYPPGRYRDLFGSWSHDSKWVSYTKITTTNFARAYAYSVVEDQSYPISDGLSDVTEPIFDPSGKYLYMLASTDAGPVVNWFDQSNQDMEMTRSIYLVTLRKDIASPLAKENDVETTDEMEENHGSDTSDLVIDWENIEHRIIDLPIDPGMYSQLAVPSEGQLYFLSRKPNAGFGTPQSLMKFDLAERESKEIMSANGFEISADGKKMLYTVRGGFGVTDVGKKPDNGRINVGAIKVKIDPVQEWENIFEETWRVNRDYFYDPGFHGLDWVAMKEKYRPFLADLSCRSDLYRVLQWMCSELAVGHHRFSSTGDRLNRPERISGGLLGADFSVENNRYRITKIYGGLNWNPEMRSPLTEPGVNVNTGDYLLAVNGQEITAAQNLYSYFENTSGKIVSLTVGPNPNFTGSRKVNVVPISNEASLRNRDWVEGNLKKVHEATDGRVAYVYVPNTAGAGHEYFKRYFFPQANKEAIIIDERYNGGGQAADYYIDILKKPFQSNWTLRYGGVLKMPSASIQGPKVMIVDETAGSGGDYLPYLFRREKLGTIIGKTTWGGLVGVLGFPEFIDGGSVTAPNLGFWDENGYGIENVGTPPDIEIEQWPKDVIAGKDPQLDKAIEVVLEQLEANPPVKLEKPDFPVRVRN